jgi:hypothetical protein
MKKLFLVLAFLFTAFFAVNEAGALPSHEITKWSCWGPTCDVTIRWDPSVRILRGDWVILANRLADLKAKEHVGYEAQVTLYDTAGNYITKSQKIIYRKKE